MNIRLRFEKRGGHYHCRLFTGISKQSTHGKCGDLVFDEREWPAIRAAFESIGEVLPEHALEER